jgi:hypothetical protein
VNRNEFCSLSGKKEREEVNSAKVIAIHGFCIHGVSQLQPEVFGKKMCLY